jgi:uncharacterized protein
VVATHVPIRTCVGCRRTVEKTGLVRIARIGGVARLDATGSAPGRGAYVHPLADCVGAALRRGAVARALRIAVGADELGRLRSDFEEMTGAR